MIGIWDSIGAEMVSHQTLCHDPPPRERDRE